MAQPHVLVTGAGGLVGSALCLKLHEQGVKLRAVVRGRGAQTPWETVAIGDIGPATDWSAALAGCRAVVHLAAAVHDRKHTEADYLWINHLGTLNLAEQAASAGIERLVSVSTVKVHGDTSAPDRPLRETDPARPEDPYARSKWAAERDLRERAGRLGLDVAIVRPPLVYGPGVKANFLSLMRLTALGLPLPLAAIDNRRSLIGVDNLVDFLCLCLDHPAAADQSFLVADRELWSIGGLIGALSEALDVPCRLWPVPQVLLQTMLPARLWQRLGASLSVDCGKAERLLGWRPPYPAREQLRKTADWYRRAMS